MYKSILDSADRNLLMNSYTVNPTDISVFVPIYNDYRYNANNVKLNSEQFSVGYNDYEYTNETITIETTLVGPEVREIDTWIRCSYFSYTEDINKNYSAAVSTKGVFPGGGVEYDDEIIMM